MSQRYMPFITWDEKELQSELLKLVDKYGMPVYPKDVTDYPIVGNALGEWLKTLEYFVKGDTASLCTLSVSVNEKIRIPVLEFGPWFCMYGVYRKLIAEPEDVLEVIRWRRERRERFEAEGMLVSEEEILYVEELEKKYGIHVILVNSEDDAQEYVEVFHFIKDIISPFNMNISFFESAIESQNVEFRRFKFNDILMSRNIINRMRSDLSFSVKCEQEMTHPILKKAKKDPLSKTFYYDYKVKFIRDDGSVKIWEDKVWKRRYFSLTTYEFVFSGTEFLDFYFKGKSKYCKPLYYSHKRFYGDNVGFSPVDVKISYTKYDDAKKKTILNVLPAGVYPVVRKEKGGKTIWRILLDDKAALEWETVSFGTKDGHLKPRFHKKSRGA